MTKSQSDFSRGVGWGMTGWRQDVRSERVLGASHVRPWGPGQSLDFFWSCCVASRILFPQPGTEPSPGSESIEF